MGLRLPQYKPSEAPRSRQRQDNSAQIIQVMGNNPYAQALDKITPILSQALERRAEARKLAKQTEIIEKGYGLKPGELSGLPLDTAAAVGKTVYEKSSKKSRPVYTGSSQDGKSLLYTTDDGPLVLPNPLGEIPASKTRDPLADEKFALQLNKQKTDIVGKFNADMNVKKAQTAIAAANSVRELVDSGNPIAANAIPTYMARASGEVGNLSEADKAPFGGSRAILARLEAAFTQQANGQLTPENLHFVRALADTMESSANRNVDLIAKTRAKQYSKGTSLREKDIYEMIRPQTAEPALPALGGGGVQPLPTGETPEQRKARLIGEAREHK